MTEQRPQRFAGTPDGGTHTLAPHAGGLGLVLLKRSGSLADGPNDGYYQYNYDFVNEAMKVDDDTYLFFGKARFNPSVPSGLGNYDELWAVTVRWPGGDTCEVIRQEQLYVPADNPTYPYRVYSFESFCVVGGNRIIAAHRSFVFSTPYVSNYNELGYSVWSYDKETGAASLITQTLVPGTNSYSMWVSEGGCPLTATTALMGSVGNPPDSYNASLLVVNTNDGSHKYPPDLVAGLTYSTSSPSSGIPLDEYIPLYSTVFRVNSATAIAWGQVNENTDDFGTVIVTVGSLNPDIEPNPADPGYYWSDNYAGSGGLPETLVYPNLYGMRVRVFVHPTQPSSGEFWVTNEVQGIETPPGAYFEAREAVRAAVTPYTLVDSLGFFETSWVEWTIGQKVPYPEGTPFTSSIPGGQTVYGHGVQKLFNIAAYRAEMNAFIVAEGLVDHQIGFHGQIFPCVQGSSVGLEDCYEFWCQVSAVYLSNYSAQWQPFKTWFARIRVEGTTVTVLAELDVPHIFPTVWGSIYYPLGHQVVRSTDAELIAMAWHSIRDPNLDITLDPFISNGVPLLKYESVMTVLYLKYENGVLSYESEWTENGFPPYDSETSVSHYLWYEDVADRPGTGGDQAQEAGALAWQVQTSSQGSVWTDSGGDLNFRITPQVRRSMDIPFGGPLIGAVFEVGSASRGPATHVRGDTNVHRWEGN